MSEELTIQCERCGTIFSDLEEVCPYCGQPHPDLLEDEAQLQAPSYQDWEELPPEEDLLYDDDGYASYPDEDTLVEEEYPPPAEGYYPPEEYWEPVEEELFAEDSLLAGDDDEPYEVYDSLYDEYGRPYGEEDSEAYDELEDEDEEEEEAEPRRLSRRRMVFGCLGLFLCVGLFYGAIGLLGVYHGLQERAQITQTEAEDHYQKGQEHLANNSLELAIAEFELALSLNPNLLAARKALREAERLALAQPTPTSETRSAAAASILETAEAQIAEEKWTEAVETLAQVRDLDADYQVERVSDLIHQANYQLGLQLTRPNQIEEAVLAFETALSERPDDAELTVELAKALAYIEGTAAQETDRAEAIEALKLLYQEDPDYLDVKKRLLQNYEAFGDELLAQEEWCRAETQFVEASLLEPSDALKTKTELSMDRCREAGSGTVAQATRSATRQPQPQPTTANQLAPSDTAATATPALTATTTTAGVGGTIFFSAFNPYESEWEILSVPAQGGEPQLVVSGGTMPAVSPNGQLVVYRSEQNESVGFHIFDRTAGEDNRITILRQHVLPRWGGDNARFLFSAQEPATGRWRIHLGFADGKSDPIILRDGRTPDWSSDNRLIAYHGADAQGNNPGLYIVPFEGGEAIRLTNHESDRAPVFSPDGSRLAYMSTRGGNWDIYTISTAGSSPRQITTNPSQDGLPAWSPTGSHFAYVSDAGGSWAIYTISATGHGSPTRVTAWDGLNRPDWLLAQIWWGR